MRLSRSLLALGLTAAASPAALGQTKPTLWVQMDNSYTVNSAATTNCDVIKMFIPVMNRGIDRTGSESAQFQSAFDDGVATADALCTTIAAAPPARLCIHLNGFGAGGRYGDPDDANANYWDAAPTVVFHPADRIPSGSACGSGPNFQQTPWPEHGRSECSAWMKGFCHKYRLRQQADPTIPNPEHISFDNEAGMGAGNALSTTLSTWTAYIGCLMSDPRSGANSSYSSQWRYLPGNFGEHKTLAQSYRDARIRYDGDSSDTTLPLSGSTPDPSSVMSASGGVQRLFVTWLNGMWNSVASDVMASMRPTIETYFSGCTFSNFNDMNADGVVSSGAPPYVYDSPFGDHYFANQSWNLIQGSSGYRLAYDNYSGWNNRQTANLASTDAPCFYTLNAPSGWVSTTEDYDTEFRRYFVGQLDAINFSNDQIHRHRVIPWIAGAPVLTGWGFTVDNNWYRDLFALGRAKGVKDYLYFQPSPGISSTDKAAIDTVMGDVWGPTIGCVTANMGTILNTGDYAKALSESDAQHLNVSSIYFYGVYAANFIVKFKVPSGFNPDKIKIAIEAYTTFDDSSTPTGTYDVVVAARPYRTTDSTFFGHFATVYGATTPVPTSGSVVADPGSDFIVSSSTSGVCSSTGDEVWVFIGAQTQGGFTPKAFTLHVDHVMIYGYE